MADVNGDGFADAVVSDPYTSPGNVGWVTIYLGSSVGLSLLPNYSLFDSSEYAFGMSVASAGDVNGDGFDDIVVGSAGNVGQSKTPVILGRAYLFLGSATGPSTTPAWTSDRLCDYECEVAGAGDVNGDGLDDVILGARTYDAADRARAFVFLGTSSGLEATPVWSASAEAGQSGSEFGSAVGRAGDVNGDGFADVVIGAWQYPTDGTYKGKAYVFLGKSSGVSNDAWWSFTGGSFEELGTSVGTAGDVNGDGFDDVLTGGADEGARVRLFLGSSSVLSASAWAPSEFIPTQVGVGRGDVNGDGYDDVALGAPIPDWNQNTALKARAFVYLGSPAGLGQDASAWTITGETGVDTLGDSLSIAGDLNGDGLSDLLIGRHFSVDYQHGQAIAYFSSVSGLTVSTWTAGDDPSIDPIDASVANAGDVNGDGFPDVLLGTPGALSGRGSVRLYSGSSSGLSTTPSWTLSGDNSSYPLGTSVAGAGDVNHDGYADVVVAAAAANTARVLAFYGSAAGLGSTTPNWSYDIPVSGTATGTTVAGAGDVNHDGYADVIVTVPSYMANGQSGIVLLFLGSATGLAPTPGWTVEGPAGGPIVVGGLDVNGDGYSDVVVGSGQGSASDTALFVVSASAATDATPAPAGRALVFLGGPSGLALTPALELDGTQAGEGFGSALASAGDVNHDGYGDLLVGSPLHDVVTGQHEGRASLFLGSATGLSATAAWHLDGTTLSGHLGQLVAGAGDVNHDTFADVLVGSRTLTPSVFVGAAAGLGTTAAWQLDNVRTDMLDVGCSAAAVDANADGYSDLLLGSVGRGWLYASSGNCHVDPDGDGIQSCDDSCPFDGNKQFPGACGCGTADTDSDADGTADCKDECPNDPNKLRAGLCGCGVAESACAPAGGGTAGQPAVGTGGSATDTGGSTHSGSGSGGSMNGGGTHSGSGGSMNGSGGTEMQADAGASNPGADSGGAMDGSDATGGTSDGSGGTGHAGAGKAATGAAGTTTRAPAAARPSTGHHDAGCQLARSSDSSLAGAAACLMSLLGLRRRRARG